MNGGNQITTSGRGRKTLFEAAVFFSIFQLFLLPVQSVAVNVVFKFRVQVTKLTPA